MSNCSILHSFLNRSHNINIDRWYNGLWGVRNVSVRLKICWLYLSQRGKTPDPLKVCPAWFGLVSLFNGVSTFVVCLLPKPSSYWYYLSHSLGNKSVYIFPKGISPKVRMIRIRIPLFRCCSPARLLLRPQDTFRRVQVMTLNCIWSVYKTFIDITPRYLLDQEGNTSK